MKFTKMHGIGNDYVYVNAIEHPIENPSELAIAVSDRHFGIGSDGLILICPSEKADFMMDMYNADGSRGKMCGNGIRCVGKYVYDHGLTDKKIVTIETLSGIKTLNLSIKPVGEVLGYNQVSNKGYVVSQVTVNMGSPVFNAADIPVKLAPGYAPKKLGSLIDIHPIKNPQLNPDEKVVEGMGFAINDAYYNGTCLSMGNPHCVVFVDDTDHFPVEKVGRRFEKNELFPEGVNTEFVQIIDKTHVKMRVWERGSGETMACGTGACATAVACMLSGKLADLGVDDAITQESNLPVEELTVSLLGGDLKIKWDREENTVFMTGPATTVFEGDY